VDCKGDSTTGEDGETGEQVEDLEGVEEPSGRFGVEGELDLPASIGEREVAEALVTGLPPEKESLFL